MAGLSVEIVHSASIVEAHCPVCTTAFALTFPAVILYQDNRPLGYLCERCLMLGPRRAAPEVRARARELRATIEQASARLPRQAWPGMMQALHERAEFWEGMADEFDMQGWWVIRQEGIIAPRNNPG